EARIGEGGDRIKEARREASQTAIAESSVWFEGLELLQIDAQFGHDRFRIVVEAEIREVVAESAAHEEFHGEVVQPLRILLDVTALALAHRVERRTPHSHRKGMKLLTWRGFAPQFSAREAQKRFDAFSQVYKPARHARFRY